MCIRDRLYNYVLLVVNLYVGSGVFGINNLISGLYLHGNLFAVYYSAWANCDNFSLLWLLLCLSW